MRRRYPRVVFEGTGKGSRRRYRIVELASGRYSAEERFRDALEKPRWEHIDLDKICARDVIRIFGDIAGSKRTRRYSR